MNILATNVYVFHASYHKFCFNKKQNITVTEILRYFMNSWLIFLQVILTVPIYMKEKKRNGAIMYTAVSSSVL